MTRTEKVRQLRIHAESARKIGSFHEADTADRLADKLSKRNTDRVNAYDWFTASMLDEKREAMEDAIRNALSAEEYWSSMVAKERQRKRGK